MKVIFVIQGEGRGHLTQALALGQMLRHEGHEVVKVLVGKSKNRVIPAFFQNQIGCGIEQFYSPNFRPSKDNRRFNLLRSIAYNVALVPSYVASISMMHRVIKESGRIVYTSQVATTVAKILNVPFMADGQKKN